MIELCRASDLREGSCKEFSLDNGDIFVVRQNGNLYAYLNRCPHLGIALNWQENIFLDDEGEFIQCATHGALFLIDNGKCVAGPCLNQQLAQCKISERDGIVFFEGTLP